MTKYEKLTIIVSVLALLVAASNPFIVYKWLNPPLKEIKQELKQRGRLQVTSNRGSDEYHRQVIRKIIMEDDSETIPIPFNVEIGQPAFVLEPPSQYDLVSRPDQIFVTVKRPIAPKDTLKVTFRDYPSRVAVSNEYVETSTIDTQLGYFHRNAELKQELRNYSESKKTDNVGKKKHH